MSINIEGYPNIINNKFLTKVDNRAHPMAKLPFNTKNDEELIVENRFKELCNSYARTYKIDKMDITIGNQILVSAVSNFLKFAKYEKPHRSKLIILAEKIIRSQYNLGYDEVLFDLEIVDIGECGFPEEMNTKKRVTDDFEQTKDLDELKKRTINALSQGAAKKSHYIFHMYGEEINKLSPFLIGYYQKAIIANDLFYYVLDDDALADNLDKGNNDSNAGYVRINFDGPIPVIEAKATCFPFLIHEMTKGCISLFSIPGIQNMTQESIDEVDYVMAELYEIRFGPTIWEKFHGLIEPADYDIKKLIMVEIFKKEAQEFHDFMLMVLNNPIEAQKEIGDIVKIIRVNIMEYNFENVTDDNLPDVDFTEFGF